MAMPKALLGSWRLRQLHVVAAGVHALLARFKEPAASLRQGRALLQVAHKFEDVLALPITARFDAASRHEGLGLVAQDFLDLAGCPDEELALFAFAVGVLRAVKSPGGIRHLPHNIVQDFLRDGAEERVAGHRLTSF